MRRMFSEKQIKELTKGYIEDGNLNINGNINGESFGIGDNDSSKYIDDLNANANISQFEIVLLGQFIYLDMTLEFTDDVSSGTQLFQMKSDFVPSHNHFMYGAGAGNTASRLEMTTDGKTRCGASQTSSSTLHFSTLYLHN